jgi:glycosyltransferase involved in cell wall biosynthesis
MKKLSIIIPVYNEAQTVISVLENIKELALENCVKELIVVDDGSTDQSGSKLNSYAAENKNIILLKHNHNRGKGAAVKTGLERASGDIVLIQDADLEYDPKDIPTIIKPIMKNETLVVYGSRRLHPENKKHSTLLFLLGGIFLSWMTNILYGSKLTDEPTGYKCFDKRTLTDINIIRNGFDWEPEVTAKILKQGIHINEVPVRYTPRRRGKKITYRDGLIALWILIQLRFSKK